MFKKSDEIFDIFDRSGNRIGSSTRSEVHTKGYWHRTFQCWLWRQGEAGERWLLFQQRHPHKDTYGGLLDISCAGHLLAGEEVRDGLRELEEELGLRAAFEELTPCGVYADEKRLADGCIDREFCHVFLLHSERPLDAYRLQPEEVTGLYAVRLDDVVKLAAGKLDRFQIEGVKLVSDIGELVPDVKRVGEEDFVPRSQSYYDLLFQALAKQPLTSI